MCGVFGYFDRTGRSLPHDGLAAMSAALAHRGPDDRGMLADEGLAIGNTRLSIIDIDGGHQPFVSEDGDVAVVQNGEIYNYIELAQSLKGTPFECRTQCDTEVLLRLYQRDGIGFLSQLNGMFAIAIYDRRKRAVLLARDRVGVKPLFVHNDGVRITFASEIKSILAVTGPRDIDPEGLSQYLTFNYVPPPYTMFQGIRHVEPGTWLELSRAGVKATRWWDLAAVDRVEQSEARWIDELMGLLDDAVRIRLRADVNFGAFLSGGIDSSTVTGLMARHMSKPVRTFSIGFHDPRYDETQFAETAAKRFDTSHISKRVDPQMLDLWPMATFYCDQPHGDVSFLPTYKVSELAAEHVKMVLTGDGGDELFAGYDKYRDFFTPNVDELDQDAFRRSYYRNISLFDDRAKSTLYRRVASDAFDRVSALFDEVKHWDRINQALYLDMQLLLPGNNLVKPDRMGMAVSLEARTPFLDYRVVELAFRMPGALKLKNGVTKWLLKQAVAPLIGTDLAYRSKQMFTVPVGDWFRSELRDYCELHLGARSHFRRSDVLTDSGYQSFRKHCSGEQNNTRQIRALIALDHWANAFQTAATPAAEASARINFN